MARVTGLGGIFFKSRDPKALAEWYAKHLGLPVSPFGGVKFAEDESRPGVTLWTPFKEDTDYFKPGTKDFMINFRVDDLDALLHQLRSEGVQVDANVQDSDYGK